MRIYNRRECTHHIETIDFLDSLLAAKRARVAFELAFLFRRWAMEDHDDHDDHDRSSLELRLPSDMDEEYQAMMLAMEDCMEDCGATAAALAAALFVAEGKTPPPPMESAGQLVCG